jgi:diketogulonate reductase-like aldo/keto reductase
VTDFQAWGPLARAQRFDHPSIQKVAKKHGKDQAQIFLRWGLQHVRPVFLAYIFASGIRSDIRSSSCNGYQAYEHGRQTGAGKS